ncbi:ABC transporter ATP-binding protein [Clostridium sp. YIM B02505]|uniref:ABC transporter ATP-binding protein n=1 Tax=Clostridium yunnanense TaxID=2800325 RepID=A0ABS1ETI4_9CLOT|nr:ABC transporter ATP-binding protein [Clostridium yunnanense]MBK1812682.1 ABC transporter ATP-binding protein [Clostridium yunnanense]
MSIIVLNDIVKYYEKGSKTNIFYALRGIDLTIDKGEMVAIMGTSGSGKTTLLNILGMLDNPCDGEYVLDGQTIKNLKGKDICKLRNKKLGFVVQNFALLDNTSVYDNIAIPLEYAKVDKKQRRILITSMLKKLGIEDKIYDKPKNLSGGQCQRVAIARALVNNPDIILADEPTGALDKNTTKEILEIFKNLNLEGKTIIIVTHDENVAKECDRIIRIEDGLLI